jgi:hypothetical protein
VTVNLEAPPPSPDAYVDMGPVEPSHYQGLWELRQGLQQEQQQQDEEEEEQPFFMELVNVLSYILLCFCSHVATGLCSLCPEVRTFRREREKERERDSCYNLPQILKFICSIEE